MKRVHKREISYQISREHQITDKEVIDRLRDNRIKYRQYLIPKPVAMDEIGNETIAEMIGKDKEFKRLPRSSFMPVEYSEFKPVKDRFTCQYCGIQEQITKPCKRSC